jgi:hypothetical protein
LIWHGGSLNSYTSLIWLFPDMDMAIFGSVNGQHEKNAFTDTYTFIHTIFYYVADHLLDHEPWLNSTTACSFPKPWHVSVPSEPTDNRTDTDTDNRNDTDNRTDTDTDNGKLSVNDLSQFVGTYGHPMYGQWVVSPSSDPDMLVGCIGVLCGNLYRTADDNTMKTEFTKPMDYLPIFKLASPTGYFPMTFQKSPGSKDVDILKFLNMAFDRNIQFTDPIQPDVPDKVTSAAHALYSGLSVIFSSVSYLLFIHIYEL